MTTHNNATSSKKTLLMMVLVFVLPVVLAKLALDNNWFNQGATNKGQLMTPTLSLDASLKGLAPKWRLLYTLPQQCDLTCENALFSINQVWLALGKNADRAEALVVVTEASDNVALAALSSYPNVKVHVANQPIEMLSDSAVYIVDTQFNAMLFYTMNAERNRAVMESRNILADIRKLLKLSRIG